ncbi:orotate phosphoribosyltransferase [Aphelenchoides avenae]|nr:orotate phosphoribosyltransferase [Aphelenchus avenae]
MTTEVLHLLDRLEAFKLGNFTLKTGVKSPIYIDLRVMISCPETYKATAESFCDKIRAEKLEFDYIAGAPYGAVPMASWVCFLLNKPLIFVRQQAKEHGTKKLIDGVYKAGQKVLIIEDVVTSGSSVLETIDVLKNAGLHCTDVVCQLDRQQGGKERLNAKGINLMSLMNMDSVLDYLETTANKITSEKRQEIIDALNVTTASIPAAIKGPSWNLQKRLETFTNALNRDLVDIAVKKQTNLCIAVDCARAEDVLKAMEKTAKYACAFKVHWDIIDDFTIEFAQNLRQMADKNDCLLLEDRKFGDIDEVTRRQLLDGPARVASWADLITQHATAGANSVEVLKKVIGQGKLRGSLLVAEMSSKGALTKGEYTADVVAIAHQNKDVVAGFICQRRCSSDPGYLYWTPGVREDKTEQDGQQWRTVERAVVEEGNDIIIVGRGITEASDPAAEAAKYAKNGWDALQKRDSL